MNHLSKDSVSWIIVDESGDGQRIDNFLIRQLKGVPKSHIYRILRSGEVRVNSGRVDASSKLALGDKLRIPPIRVAERTEGPKPGSRPGANFSRHIIFEDDHLLVVDKPAGVAVHGGSGISMGVVEQLRAEHPEFKFLELVHRIDRETSGLLLLAKKRSALVSLHEAIREGRMEKFYLTLVSGRWQNRKQSVKLPLHKYVNAAGERRVVVSEEGMPSHTLFRLLKQWSDFSLLEAELKTGRTHQIRVHLSHLGFPIAGDDKYGDFPLNKALAQQGLKRMFLHAHRVRVMHPGTGAPLELEAPLPPELARYVTQLDEKEQDRHE